jgi:hypothetical protein
MTGNVAKFDTDGLVVGNGQLSTSGGDVSIGKNLFISGDVVLTGSVRGVSQDTYTVVDSRPGAAINIPLNQGATFFTGATTNNIALNFVLTNNLPVNNSAYFTVILTNAAIAYTISSITIDGSYNNVFLRWAGGPVPPGSPNFIDYYSFQILRTAVGYYIFASAAKF